MAKRHAPSVNLLYGKKNGLVTKLLRGPYVNRDSDRESLAMIISDAISRAVQTP